MNQSVDQTPLLSRFRELSMAQIPLPGKGQTALRLQTLAEIGRESLSLARLLEAHYDAVAILAEAGRSVVPGALYGVWASESPKTPMSFHPDGSKYLLNGRKGFCSGAGLLDRALVTVTLPEHHLIDLDLRANQHCIRFDHDVWRTAAFEGTRTAGVEFCNNVFDARDFVGDVGWYLDRPGFWIGALAPAACWAGGALGLVDYATSQSRNDPHTLAHLGGLHAWRWALHSYLDCAGNEVDSEPENIPRMRTLARTVRHLVDHASTDVLQRLGRAYGPQPLAMNADVSLRCQELALYIRQCHAERDLEHLGKDVLATRP